MNRIGTSSNARRGTNLLFNESQKKMNESVGGQSQAGDNPFKNLTTVNVV